MKFKLIWILCIVSLILCAVGCGKTEESTTVTGIVVSVDGSVISVRTMGSQNPYGANGRDSQRPTGEEGRRFPSFDGEMPERPTGEKGRRFPSFNGETPERPTGEEGRRFPSFNGEMPERPTGEEGRGFPSFNGENTEAKSYDLSTAHISVEIDEGKASGTMEDVKQGSIVTLTLNKKGEVTLVLVSSRNLSGFGNRGQGGDNGLRPQRGGNEEKAEEKQTASSEDQPGL